MGATDLPADQVDYFTQSVTLTPDDLRAEFVRIPGDLSYWGQRYAEAYQAHLLAENWRKEVEARTRLLAKHTAQGQGGKAPTVDDLASMVLVDEDCREARLAEVEADAARLAAKLRYDAVASRRDMAVSLGAHVRAEMAGDPSIRQR